MEEKNINFFLVKSKSMNNILNANENVSSSDEDGDDNDSLNDSLENNDKIKDNKNKIKYKRLNSFDELEKNY